MSKRKHPLMAIHYRQQLREKLIELDNLTCENCRSKKARQRVWAWLMERLLYKKRQGE